MKIELKPLRWYHRLWLWLTHGSVSMGTITLGNKDGKA